VKKIFKSLLSKKNESSLSARLSWLSELNQLDDINGLKLTLKQVTALLNDTALSTHEKIELILHVEDVVDEAVTHQLSSFAKVDNLKADLTSAIVENNYSVNRSLFLTHTKLIEMSFSKAPDQQPSDLIKYTLIARGLMYGIHMLMWRYYEHAPVPASIWLQASALYKLAETHLVAQKPASPFKDTKTISIQQLYLQLIMLGSINYNNLTKLQIEMVHNILNAWVQKIQPSHTHSTQHVYFIDLEKNDGVTRIRNQRMPERALYWHMDNIELEIELTLQQIREHKTPSIMQELSSQSLPLLQETLQFLKKEWSRKEYKRQRRKEAREETTRTAAVAVGIQSMFSMLKQFDLSGEVVKSLIDGTLNDRRLSTGVVMRGSTNTIFGGPEKWAIHDESLQGVGSVLPLDRASQLKPNKLLALFSQNRDALPAIGVVRNLTQITGGKVKVGIELFTHHPVIAILKKFDTKKEQDTNTESSIFIDNAEFWGIFLPKQNTSDQTASIILPKLEYLPSQFYSVTLNKRREIVKFQAPIESGDDWVRLSFPEDFS
jgi:hypothetical protein